VTKTTVAVSASAMLPATLSFGALAEDAEGYCQVKRTSGRLSTWILVLHQS
jgi:hypothetical protein